MFCRHEHSDVATRYHIIRMADTYAYVQGPGVYPACECKAVPLGALTPDRKIAAASRPQKTTAAPVTDPSDLATCKKPEQFHALAIAIGMSVDESDRVLDLCITAPNNGQLVMRGRNLIRGWLKRNAK